MRTPRSLTNSGISFKGLVGRRLTRTGNVKLLGTCVPDYQNMVTQVKTPPLRLLRAFCLAARHSSFKDAADRLGLTPSAVSHQVKELEEQLGVSLFQRRTRGGAIDRDGPPAARRPRAGARGAERAIARTARAASARRQLHLVMPPFFASELFAPRLQDFHERHPTSTSRSIPTSRDPYSIPGLQRHFDRAGCSRARTTMPRPCA